VAKNCRCESVPIAFGGIFSGIVLSGLIGTTVSEEYFIQWVKEFQTLISGIIALVGALFTVAAIRRQISSSEKSHEDLLERNLVSARSVLPMALSELVTYGESCLSVSFRMAKGHEIEPLKKLSGSHNDVFREVIKYAPQERQEQMAELLAHLQVQISRMTREVAEYRPMGREEILYANRIGDEDPNKRENILDAAKLIFQAEDLFCFARREEEEEERSRIQRFRGLMIRLTLNPEDWPNLLDAAARRFT